MKKPFDIVFWNTARGKKLNKDKLFLGRVKEADAIPRINETVVIPGLVDPFERFEVLGVMYRYDKSEVEIFVIQKLS